MGLFSGSKKINKTVTSNQTTSLGIGGDNNGAQINGSGNTVMMNDLGAIDSALSLASGIASDSVALADGAVTTSANLAQAMAGDAMALADGAIATNAGLVSESFSLADIMAQNNAELAQDSMSNNAELADSVIDAGAQMLGMSLDANGVALNTSALLMDSAFSKATGLVSNQQEVNNSTLMAGYELATKSVSDGNALALALTEQTTDAMTEQSSDTFDSLNNGFKSMMQFADNASRSDGSVVAQSSNKVLMVGLGVAGLVVAATFLKGAK